MDDEMTYREHAQFCSTSEGETTPSYSSSSSDNESEILLGTLSSPSSDYLVQGILGQGCFGKVAKCFKSATKEKVAVKIMKSRQYTAEVKKEVYILRRLRALDPERFNFIKFNDAFIYRRHICLEFEMLDISLFDFVNNKPKKCLSVKEIRPILHQMATALQLLSRLGVAHTDLKPDNIMMVDHINQPLKIKMIDFGLACHVSELKQGLLMQPLSYRSPEVILGLPTSTAIDMWSLGCVAAELFLGHVLYTCSSEFHVLQQMEQVQGQIPQSLLKNGFRTNLFFQKKRGHRCWWRLKTPCVFGPFSKCESLFNSLDDLKKIRPACHLSEDDTMAEIEDQVNFVDLLKLMLQLDMIKRITPGLLLEDPFITMTNLSHSYPDSFYIKAGCEMMEVCLDQSLSSGLRSDTQASTSTASRVVPAWHNRQEHPLVMQMAKAVYNRLSIHDDPRPSQPLPLGFQFNRGKKRKKKRSPCEDMEADDSSPESIVQAKKRIKTHAELPHKSKEDPAEASPSPVTATPQRKRLAAFVALYSGLSSSPEMIEISSLHDSKEAPVTAPSKEAEIKLSGKRKSDTFVDSHSGSSPESVVQAKKRIKTHAELPQKYTEDPAEASPSPITATPQRKRLAAFVALCSGLSSSQEMIEISPLHDSKEAPVTAPSKEAEIKLSGKRKSDTFVASHSGSSPESVVRAKKRIKTHAELPQTSKEDSAEASPSPVKATPRRKRMLATFVGLRTGLRSSQKMIEISPLHDSKEAPVTAPSKEAKIKLSKKRMSATLVASHSGLTHSDPPEKKKRKTRALHDSKEAPVTAPSKEAEINLSKKRMSATFVASHSGLTHSDPPEKKKRKMSLVEEETQTSERRNSIPDCPSPKKRLRKNSLAGLQRR